jgi:hypothetical protein
VILVRTARAASSSPDSDASAGELPSRVFFCAEPGSGSGLRRHGGEVPAPRFGVLGCRLVPDSAVPEPMLARRRGWSMTPLMPELARDDVRGAFDSELVAFQEGVPQFPFVCVYMRASGG